MPLQRGGGTWGTPLYAVRGVGSERRDVDAWHANGLYTEDRGIQVPMTLKHGPVTSSGKSATGPDPRIRHRIQIGMFRPIRVDHTNCLQVAIKTHSFILKSLQQIVVLPLSRDVYKIRCVSVLGPDVFLCPAELPGCPIPLSLVIVDSESS